MKLSMDEKHFITKIGDTKKRHIDLRPSSFFYKNERFERFFTSGSKMALRIKLDDHTENRSDPVTSRKSIRGHDDDKRSQ